MSFATVTAILYALASPNAEPVPMGAYFTDAGPAICQATADSLNEQSTETTDPRFYCDE